MPSAFRSSLLAALVYLPLLAGCDDTPGVSDPFGTPPTIASFDLTPDEIIDTSGSETVTLAPVLSLTLRDGEAPVTVRALIRDLDGGDLLAELEETATGGTIDLRPTFDVPRGAIGRYPVTVTTEDASGRIGDRATAVIVFSSESRGGPTVTGTAASPDPIPRPASGSATVTLVADATDPDGIANLAYLDLRTVDGETLFRMRDDGDGVDGTAGDGRYALGLSINSGTPTGTFLFNVVAVDRTGVESTPAEITFTVQ